VPPASPSTLPDLIDIEIISGATSYSLPGGLAYYEPNYDNWAAPLAGAGLASPSLDIDGDHLENLVEYLCDLDPLATDPMPLLAVTGGEGILHLNLRR
ncbi:MAG: hypothetical protein GWO24_17895, partial [Akkermansiaceae bacterium]|nr:hypothetical protein [Akkermansiaceae bacterium]